MRPFVPCFAVRLVFRWAPLVALDLSESYPGEGVAYLREVNLSGSILTDSNFTGAQLERAVLIGADLTRVDFSRAALDGADLSHATLRRTTLSNVSLLNAGLSRANFFEADLFDASLVGANLAGAFLCAADLSGANLVGAALTEADFSLRARPPASRLDVVGDSRVLDLRDESGADLSLTRLIEADLSGADLSQARNLSQSQLDSACTALHNPPSVPPTLNWNVRLCFLGEKPWERTRTPSRGRL